MKIPISNDVSTAVGSQDRNTETSKKYTPGEIYIVASWNDWQPARMKTNKALNLEKFALDDEQIDKDIFGLDDTQLLYSNMVPPGQHFFYLTQENSQIFLTPKNDIVRFKKTNVFLNRVIVKPRLED